MPYKEPLLIRAQEGFVLVPKQRDAVICVNYLSFNVSIDWQGLNTSCCHQYATYSGGSQKTPITCTMEQCGAGNTAMLSLDWRSSRGLCGVRTLGLQLLPQSQLGASAMVVKGSLQTEVRATYRCEALNNKEQRKGSHFQIQGVCQHWSLQRRRKAFRKQSRARPVEKKFTSSILSQ